MQVSPRVLSQLRAVFGDCVPRENASTIFEQSPLAPADPEERAALQAFVFQAAGTKLSLFEPSSIGSSVTARAMPAATSLQLQQLVAAKETKTADGLIAVISEKKADAIFAAVANMADIPHDFLEDGCLHRAHMMAKRIEEMGIFCDKAFVIPRSGDLVIDTAKAQLGFTVVWYHEAVCVHVRTDKGVERRVLDPSVSDKPQSLDEWRRSMSVAPPGTPAAGRTQELETFFLPRFAHGLGDRDNPPTSWRPEDLKDAAEFTTGEGWRATKADYEGMGFYTGELHRLAGRA